MDIRLKHTPAIYLTGFMGCGKSTVGKLLAERLGWGFVDFDHEIEAAEQDTIPHLFATRGIAEFRRLETEMLRQWVRKVDRGLPYVIALGGGTFAEPGNPEIIEHHGISMWLDCPLEVIERRLEQADREARPLAAEPEFFRDLYAKRLPAYGRANYRLNADCEPADVVEEILKLPIWK